MPLWVAAVAAREGVPLRVAAAAIREQAAERAIQIQQQRIMFAQTCREIADRSLEVENVAMAVLNYRRAAFVAPHTEEGQAAARAIGVLQKDAETELQQVNRLIAAQEFDQAIECLTELRRDYSALWIAPMIEQALRRSIRLREASERVARVESRVRSDRTAEDPATDRVVESFQPRDDRAPVGTERGRIDAIRKLAEQNRGDSAGPRLRGSEPRR